ncbi:MAG: glycosyltransferase family 4 protein [Pseudomonadota bacterium]
MHVAFFAPLKPPDHPTPSGDREMGKAIVAALRHKDHRVSIASTIRLREGQGSKERQAEIARAASDEVARLIADPASRDWDVWLTYHNYYKAPDLVGPAVCAALGIPYAQIESTRARKRLTGLWADFAHAAEEASEAASAIFYFTQHDAEALQAYAPDGQRLIHLPPFLQTYTLPDPTVGDGPILSVGMMRRGDKLASYRLIADTLALLPTFGWHLTIVGDGEARAAVEAMMVSFGDRVSFVGAIEKARLAEIYASSSLFFWPGVNEAFGMVYLEAQAAGLPVIAQDRPGVRDIVHGVQPRVFEGPEAMADVIKELLHNPKDRARLGAEARSKIERHHLLGAAARTLSEGLEAIT